MSSHVLSLIVSLINVLIITIDRIGCRYLLEFTWEGWPREFIYFLNIYYISSLRQFHTPGVFLLIMNYFYTCWILQINHKQKASEEANALKRTVEIPYLNTNALKKTVEIPYLNTIFNSNESLNYLIFLTFSNEEGKRLINVPWVSQKGHVPLLKAYIQ